ncbi:sensor histidine kinase [Devosia sediminis]|uniref:histidine kinase n=1 Tax=Devosia sediminis TaxID=2798801 RepID=A0A934IQ74_9HYPH|nr:HAMP domain-containing sensor histidine kinase [Devosia sediminis]MBJ3783171.1 HAMP domain-containing histidine kinase [Devosia sediminis]
MTRRPWISRPFLAAVLALTVLFTLLLAAVTRLAVNENRISGERDDSVIWFASQGQYEAMRLADATLLFEAGRVAPEELALRFDLLDSRLSLFEQGVGARLVEDLGYRDEVQELRDTFETQRLQLPLVRDGDPEALLGLHGTARAMGETMRDVANAGMLDSRNKDDMVRDTRRRILVEVLSYLLATLAAGVLVAFIVVRGFRTTMRAEAALEHERQISRLHRAFTSVVSHQFRTPLTIIDASAQRMLRRGAAMTQDEVISRATKIRKACQRLTRLMESTLNAARLEQGEITFHPRPCDLQQVVATVVDMQPEDDQSRIVLALEDLPRLVMADTALLEQAIHNLISNGLKYSAPNSQVLVRGRREANDVIISVVDNGVGIPADEIPFITERFFRARTAQGIAGTGIGLHFVSQIMDLHGGRIEVSSAEGKGSTISLVFPYRPAERAGFDPVRTD